MKSRVCSRCKKDKPLDQFYKSTYGKYGKTAQCKQCLKEKVFRPYRKKGIERQNIDKFISKMTSGVYLVNAGNGTYIGQSKHIENRVYNHRSWNYNSPVEGYKSFKVLEVVEDSKLRLKREKYWIKKLQPNLNKL